MSVSSPPIVSVGTLMRMLLERGIDLYLDGGLVRWKGAPGAMTVPMVLAIKRYQPELVELLRVVPGQSTA